MSKEMQLIKRAMVGGYVKADTIGNGNWEIGRITKFDDRSVTFSAVSDGQEISINRQHAYKATAEEYEAALRAKEAAEDKVTAEQKEEELIKEIEQSDLSAVFKTSRSIVPDVYRRAYVKTTSHSGTNSLNNGDQVARALAGLDLDSCYDVMSEYVDEEVLVTKMAKWSKLNPGQQRMQIGNAIRAVIKKAKP